VLNEVGKRIEWAMNARAPYEREWLQALNYYVGKQWGEVVAAIDNPVVVNRFWPLVNAALPSLFFQNPRIYVQPLRKWAKHVTPWGEEVKLDLEANANSAEAATDALWRNQELKYEVRSAIVDAMIFSFGYIKVGYSSPKGVPREDEIKSQIRPEAFTMAQEAIPGITQEDFLRLSGKGELLDFDTNIRPGHPFGQRIDPLTVWWDPKADKTRNARFVIHAWDAQLRTLKADPLFSNLEGLDPEDIDNEGDLDDSFKIPGMRSNMSHPPDLEAQATDPVKSVRVYEYYDKERQEVYWLVRQPARQGREYLSGWRCIRRSYKWPFEHIPDFPIIALGLNFVPNRLYPLTGIQQWISQQRELNILRTVQLEHARRENRKILMEQDAMQPDQKEILRNPAIYGIVEVNPGKLDSIRAMDSGSMNYDLLRMEQSIEADIQRNTGFLGSPTAQGQAQPHRISATESSQIGSAIGTLSEDQLGLVSDFAGKVSKFQFLIFRQFWSESEMMQRVNATDGKEWVPVTPDTLMGDFDFRVEVGSTQRLSAEVRQKRAIELMTLVTNPIVVQLFGPKLVQKVLEWVFRAFDIAFPEALFSGAEEYMLPADRAKMEQAQMRSGMGAAGQPGPQQGQMQPNQSGGGPVTPMNQFGQGMGTVANVLQGQRAA